MSQSWQFAIVCAAMMLTWVSYSYIQELLVKTYDFKFAWFLSWSQFVVYSLIAYLERLKMGEAHTPRRGQVRWYLCITLAFAVARGLGNLSHTQIDYTTKTLFQSSKVVPVMIVGVILLRKHYMFMQYFATFMLVVGLAIFSFADANTSAHFNAWGLLYASCDTVALAVKTNLQELVLSHTDASKMEIAYYGQLYGIYLLLPVVLVTNEFLPPFVACNAQPVLYLWLMLYFVLGYMGSLCNLTLVQVSDSFAATLASSIRKVLSVIISFVVFAKPVTASHWLGSVLFFAGTGFHLWIKHYKRSLRRQQKKD